MGLPWRRGRRGSVFSMEEDGGMAAWGRLGGLAMEEEGGTTAWGEALCASYGGGWRHDGVREARVWGKNGRMKKKMNEEEMRGLRHFWGLYRVISGGVRRYYPPLFPTQSMAADPAAINRSFAANNIMVINKY